MNYPINPEKVVQAFEAFHGEPMEKQARAAAINLTEKVNIWYSKGRNDAQNGKCHTIMRETPEESLKRAEENSGEKAAGLVRELLLYFAEEAKVSYAEGQAESTKELQKSGGIA